MCALCTLVRCACGQRQRFTQPSLQVARDKLAHLGTCIGKLTHSGKFRLTVGCLELLAAYAKYKVPLCTCLVPAVPPLPQDATPLSVFRPTPCLGTSHFSPTEG